MLPGMDKGVEFHMMIAPRQFPKKNTIINKTKIPSIAPCLNRLEVAFSTKSDWSGIVLLRIIRQINIKVGTYIGLAAGFDKATVILNDLFNDCKANTCSVILFLSMKPLENLKNLFTVFLSKTDALI